MADVADQAGYTETADVLVRALQAQFGSSAKPFAYFDSAADKGIGVVADIVEERRHDPARRPLQLRLCWPEPAWMAFAHVDSRQQHQRAEAFASMFMQRLSELEAWYGFQLASSSQQVDEPIEIRFEVIGIAVVPGIDGDIV